MTLPSHRILALFRAEKEEVLELAFEPEESGPNGGHDCYEQRIAARFGIRDRGRRADRWLADAVRWAWRTKIKVHLDQRTRLWQTAERKAVRVFATDLRDLLLAVPAGARVSVGLDPGLRTGVKLAVVDATGQVVATATVYPHEPQRRWDEAIATLARLAHEQRSSLSATVPPRARPMRLRAS